MKFRTPTPSQTDVNSIDTFLAKIEQRLSAFRKSKMLAAVSGGADSTSLLLALNHILNAGSPLIVGHVNHRLRGGESDEDQAFVESLCSRLSIPFHGVTLDVKAEADRLGENLEKTARDLRYRWLTELATQQGASLILTGHTADDQAETVLHRLIRGSGLRGLCGIASQRLLTEGVTLLRPMLDVTRDEVEAYLAAMSQSAREDSSNADVSFTRNRIRHELMPMLTESYNPAMAQILCRLAQQAGEMHQEEEQHALAHLAEIERPREGSKVILDLRRLRSLTPLQRRAVLRLIWRRESWSESGMGFEQWKRLESLIDDGPQASDFPGPIRARRRRDVLQLAPISRDR